MTTTDTVANTVAEAVESLDTEQDRRAAETLCGRSGECILALCPCWIWTLFLMGVAAAKSESGMGVLVPAW